MEYNYAKIGRRIAFERSRKRWNQDELILNLKQKGIHVSRNTLSKIESGRMGETNTPLNLLMALCELFDCEMGYLLCEEGYRSKTRSATDVRRQTGLDSYAIEGLKQIQAGNFDGFLTNTDLATYNTFYNPDNDRDFNVSYVLNWLFMNDHFKDFLCHLAFELQTIDWDRAYQLNYIQALKLVFEDYDEERQPRLPIRLTHDVPVDDVMMNLTLNGLKVSPEDKEEAKELINSYVLYLLGKRGS